MNVSTFERAQVASFAFDVAARTGSIQCMKAICYVLRNRVRKGWGDSTWISAIRAEQEVAGNEPMPRPPLDLHNRLLNLLVRDIDDIYLGTASDDTEKVVQDALYWTFVDLPPRAWFVENIARNHENHARIGQIGPIALFQ